MGKVDIVIRGGTVYDGTGGEPFEADIGIAGDRIAFVEKRAGYRGKADAIIVAKGLSVAPGFIDTHAHSEFTLVADGRASGKILQGVTTEINGNCGLSAAPLTGDARVQRESDFTELGIRERWESLREYFSLLEQQGIAINVGTLVGHGNIRASVVGYGNRSPDEAERGRMLLLLREAVQEGARGMSTGLIYPPGVYAETDELIQLSRDISGLVYATHMRSEGDALIEAVGETLRIGRESGIHVHISHLKTGGKENWHKIDEVLRIIDDAREQGMEVTADRYPYTAASTDLDAVLPAWTYAGGADEELRRLTDRETRGRIAGEILARHPEDDYWQSIAISSVASAENKWLEGKTVADGAVRTGKTPVEFSMDLLISERLRVSAIFHSMNEDNLRRILSLPYVMIGSDSSARSSDGPTRQGRPHPRAFGTMPRFLAKYMRGEGLMKCEEAVSRMTMLPAGTFGIRRRGSIREGFFADLVVFDRDTITDRATFDEPYQGPSGIAFVLVNGVPAVWEGRQTDARAGRVLRYGQ